MTTIIIISTIIIIPLCFALFEIGWIYGEKNIRDELIYEEKYKEIFDMIHKWNKCPENYDYIKSQIIGLRNLKFKDKERTNILFSNFWREWESVNIRNKS
jgi:hypothetical protein